MSSWRDQPAAMRRYLTACAISFAGDGIRYAALPLLAAADGAGPQGLGLLLGAATLPFLVLGIFGGVISDRLSRKHVLITCDLIRVAVTGALVGLVLAGHPGLGVLSVIAFLMGLLESVATSASFAYLPSLAEGDALVTANSASSTALLFGRSLVGPLIGAALVAVTPWLPFLLDGLSFAASALLVAGTTGRPQAAGGANGSGVRGLVADVRESARWMRTARAALGIALTAAAINLFNMGALAIQPHYAHQVLHGSGIVYGAMMASAAVGGVPGSATAARIIRRVPLGPAVSLALLLIGLGYLAVAAAPGAAVAFAGLFVTGFGFALWNVSTVTWRQRLTPDHLRGRADALHRVISWGILPLGSVLGGLLAAHGGDRLPFLLAGATPLALALLYLRRTPVEAPVAA